MWSDRMIFYWGGFKKWMLSLLLNKNPWLSLGVGHRLLWSLVVWQEESVWGERSGRQVSRQSSGRMDGWTDRYRRMDGWMGLTAYVTLSTYSGGCFSRSNLLEMETCSYTLWLQSHKSRFFYVFTFHAPNTNNIKICCHLFKDTQWCIKVFDLQNEERAVSITVPPAALFRRNRWRQENGVKREKWVQNCSIILPSHRTARRGHRARNGIEPQEYFVEVWCQTGGGGGGGGAAARSPGGEVESGGVTVLHSPC